MLHKRLLQVAMQMTKALMLGIVMRCPAAAGAASGSSGSQVHLTDALVRQA